MSSEANHHTHLCLSPPPLLRCHEHHMPSQEGRTEDVVSEAVVETQSIAANNGPVLQSRH